MNQRVLKLRLYPEDYHLPILNQHIGHNRFVYNECIKLNKKLYEATGKIKSRYELSSYIKQLKDTDKPWLKEVNAQSLQTTILNYSRAMDRYLQYLKQISKGKKPKLKAGEPKIKRKNIVGAGSFRAPQNCRLIIDNTNPKYKSSIIFYKIKKPIRAHYHRMLPSDAIIGAMIITKDNVGDWWVSIEYKTNEPYKVIKTGNGVIGIDVGVANYYTTSDGNIVKNPKYFESEINKIRKLNRIISKKREKGVGTKKLQLKQNKLYRKSHNKTLDFIHKETNKLIRENQSISIESLSVSDLLIISDHNLSRRIQYSNLSMFLNILKYKAQWSGTELRTVDKFFASSKICSNCGNKDDTITLKDRTYNCKHCGHSIDRDLNAAINIRDHSQPIK